MMGGTMEKVKPILAIISLQFGYAGMYIITMVSFKNGMDHWVLATYRHVVATFFMAPFALIFERKIRPKMTLAIFWRLLALGILEPLMDQNLYYIGLKNTSASYTSAFTNALPAVTFILALIFRLETVNFRKIHSVAKVVGTVITVGGAMIMTLYKGPAIEIVKAAHSSFHGGSSSTATGQHWVLGTLAIMGSISTWAAFFILQSYTLKVYPAELSLVTLICGLGTILNAIVSLIMVRDMSAWKIGMNSGTLAAVYSGVVCSGIAYYIQSIVIKQRGPVFTTSFSPMCMIITAFLGALVLAEKIHLGSIIGAVFIVLGLYSVVWGKSKDEMNPLEEKIVSKDQELPISNVAKQMNGGYDDSEAPATKGVFTRVKKTMVMWVFGYGSLIWKTGFPFDESLPGFIKGYRRVFHQGSTDHRGTPDFPGRTVTLEASDGEFCWGVAYKITKEEDKRDALMHLEVREKQYDQKEYVDFFTDSNSTEPAVSGVMVYIASSDKKSNKNYLGPAPLEDIAKQIVKAEGPSGPNRDYLFNLEEALAQLGFKDKHVTDLANQVRHILSDTEEFS